MSAPTVTKGRIAFGEYQTWYRLTGSPGAGKPTVAVLHGGPGSTHDYLLALTRLADHGWPVLHYDQLGNGGSTHLPDRGADFWTVDLFEAELDNLLASLDVGDDYVLVGHSWGGVLAACHAARRPPGLRGLVLAGAPASYRLWSEEMAVLRAALPPGVDETLARLEADGRTDTEEYHQALLPFYRRHVCRLDPWPRDYLASYYEVYNDPTVYYTMNGPSEFHVVGTLKDFSVEERCADIDVPTLLLSGRYDEATPRTIQPFADLIPDSRWVIFDESSHLPHVEEPHLFDQVLLGFLTDLTVRC